MSVCGLLHSELHKLPDFKAGYDPKDIPKNGIYFLFEKGELAHGGKRVVRVGTHKRKNGLSKRLKEHLYKKNKDRSVFRKHVGRCILSRQQDPFLEVWDKPLTTRKSREAFGHLVDKDKLVQVEQVVSDYMNDAFSFVVVNVENKEDRLFLESGILSVIAKCPECSASDNWLGRSHPNSAIAESGLWNVQGLKGEPIRLDDARKLFFSLPQNSLQFE